MVDVCLIPEVKFAMQGERGLLSYVQSLLDDKGHCVVCIAEGAGQVLAPSALGKFSSRIAFGGALLCQLHRAAPLDHGCK